MSARRETVRHIRRVHELLSDAALELLRRGREHDKSKFAPVEMNALERLHAHISVHGPLPYGSPEYRARTAILGPMLEHHYANNSHHPEHYPNGVAGMDLFDLIEMFFDWQAAVERNGDDAINLSYTADKYGLPEMLVSILRNTATRMEFPCK